jgi:cytochrome c peroxidase
MKIAQFFTLLFLVSLLACCKPIASEVPFRLNTPKHFPPPSIPADNALTAAKVRLGRMLFYEKRISEDQKVACANCHKQEFAFGSDKPIDEKVHGGMTSRNSSVLFNLVFTKTFFWDGRTSTLEASCMDALKGEQKFDISQVKTKLIVETQYKDAFNAAFGTSEPTEDMVVKSLASFIRTMVSGTSRVDKGAAEGNPNKYLTPIEIEGRLIFDEENEGDCFHCHGSMPGQPLMTDNLFHNNGLDPVLSPSDFRDPGLGFVTGITGPDAGKFKTGPLRNLSYSKPFMHDGRFANLDAALAHYNTGLSKDPNRNKFFDVNIKKANQGGLKLLPSKINQLKAYLLAFDDLNFINDTSFSSPFW